MGSNPVSCIRSCSPMAEAAGLNPAKYEFDSHQEHQGHYRKGDVFMPIIDVAATGANIKAMMRSKGFKVADVQARCGFNTPQAVFKWMRGDTVPTIDNMIIIADMFGVTIDQIVVVKRI